jgi:hypothetical protein
VPRAEVPALFARSDVLINNMEAGAPDKVVYEAAAACLARARFESRSSTNCSRGYPLTFERDSR